MVNISGAKRCIVDYTRNGYRLLSKELNLVPKRMKNATVPKDAVTMDIVQVESDWGNGLKTIVRYKDKDEKVIKHVMNEYYSNTFAGSTVRNYERYGKITETNTRKYDYLNNEIENVKEAISVRWGETDGSGQIISTAPHAIRTKLKTTNLPDGSKKDYQRIEHLYTHDRPADYIETTAIRQADGTFVKCGGSGNLPNTMELASDPYLYFRNYSNNEFLRQIEPYTKAQQQVLHRNITTKIEQIPRKTTLGYATTSGDVTIDTSKHKSKMDIVDTYNHEMRHQYQFDRIKALDFWRSLIGRGRSTLVGKERADALRFLRANLFYCPHFINNSLYRRNGLEVDARRAGSQAALEFEEYSKKLADSFGATREQYPLFQLENLGLKESIREMIKNAPVVTIKNLKIKKEP